MNKNKNEKTQKKVALKDLKARKEVKGGSHRGQSHRHLS